ncbi:retrovirus-related pol polyprotein from transposon TNT 1-94 [Tanacetum coccineum]|uniref:Retrovirus-related pol polyprotein from transposon TNT 1-94 n=1 Tax=Tanacetum coccineum TaxID=301880 RepID=A0ABQ5DAK6_9ASTR
MLGALRALGLNVKENGAIKRAIVEGSGGVFLVGKEAKDEIQLFLGNAGTTMRPLTAAAGGNSSYVLDGFPRMRERPIGDLVKGLKQLGADVDCYLGTNCPPVRVVAGGGLPAGKLLLHWETSPGIAYVEGDASSASYFLAGAAITGGTITVEGCETSSLQEESADKVVSLHKTLARLQVHVFLAGLDQEFNQARSEILRKDLPLDLESCDAYKGKTSNSKVGSYTCTHCGEEGHSKQRCYEIIGYPEWWDFSKKPQKIGQATVATSASKEPSPSIAVHTKKFKDSGMSSTNHAVNNAWIIDTGATDHMTNDPSKLTSKCPPKLSKILTANGGWHIQITKNLNCFVTFWPDECVFQDMTTHRILGCGTRRGQLYYLKEQGHGEAHHIEINRGNKTLAWLWHRRLGHLSFSYLRKLKPSLFLNEKGSEFKCGICEIAKIHKTSYAPSDNKSLIPFMTIHYDVWGPAKISTSNGACYFVTFIDECARMGEAVRSATYIMNRTPSRVIEFKTSIQKLLELVNTPSSMNLEPKVFGCTSYVHQNIGKLEPRAVRCVFLGYADLNKGYQCYEPKENKMYVTRDVEFHKNIPFFGHECSLQGEKSSNLEEENMHNYQDGNTTEPMSEAGESTVEGNDNGEPEFEFGENDDMESEVEEDDSITSQIVTTTENSQESHPVNTTPTAPIPNDSVLQDTPDVSGVHDTHCKKNRTLELVNLPPGKKTVGCRWIYTVKLDSAGNIDRYKARLVTKVYTQKYGIDYGDTFAPVAKINTIRILVSIAANQDWPLRQFDVKNAFLNGHLEEEVYIDAPPGIECNDKVCIEVARSKQDIAYAVSVVSQFMHDPSKDHMKAVYRILRYLKSSSGKGLFFAKTQSREVSGYTNADWAENRTDGKSTSGYFTFVGGNLVTWRSKKQKIKRILRDLGIDHTDPMKLYCDNQAAVKICNNPVQHDRTKHVEVDHHFIKDHLEKRTVELPFVASKDQLADILTKAVCGSIFHSSLCKLGMIDIHSPP